MDAVTFELDCKYSINEIKAAIPMCHETNNLESDLDIVQSWLFND